MNRTVASYLIAIVCVLLAQTALARNDLKPNIVIILSDDLGYGSASSYGADPALVKTPSIQRLAKEGRRFTDANSNSSVCTPTRYSMLTGRYAWRTSLKRSVLKAGSPLLIERGRPTLASLLKQQGYTTGAIGKWHLGYGSSGKTNYTQPLRPGPLEIGFDYHFGVPANHGDQTGVYVENDKVWGLRTNRQNPEKAQLDYKNRPYLGLDAPHRVDVDVMPFITEKAVQWIEAQSDARPFFLFFTPVAVHAPITPSAKTQGTSGAGAYGDWIHELDDSVGAILDALDSKGFSENTIVLFTSDNGGVHKPGKRMFTTEAWKAGLRINGPYRGGKHDIWEGGFRVPYLVRWPGHVPANSTSGEMLNLVDTFATLSELVGEPLPDKQAAAEDSFSMLPAWLGQASAPIRPDMILHSHDGTFAIRQGPWKWIDGDYHPLTRAQYIRERADQFKPQLYDIVEDEQETQNLASTHPDIATRLDALITRYREGGYSRELPPAPESATSTVKLALVASSEFKPLDLNLLLRRPAVNAQGQWRVTDGELHGSTERRQRDPVQLGIPLRTSDGDITYEVNCPAEACHSLRLNTGEAVYMVMVSQRWLAIIKYPDQTEPELKTVLAQSRIELGPDEWARVHVQMRGNELSAQVGTASIRAQNDIFYGFKPRMFFVMDGEHARFRKLATYKVQ